MFLYQLLFLIKVLHLDFNDTFVRCLFPLSQGLNNGSDNTVFGHFILGTGECRRGSSKARGIASGAAYVKC